MSCEHPQLSFAPSAHADTVRYCRATAQQRAAATISITTRNRKDASNDEDTLNSTFPAPLVLPGDDLSLDPRYPPQSLRSWRREKERNEVTPKKNVIYVAAPPEIAFDVEFVRAWSRPQILGTASSVTAPRIADVIDYLTAFYHGLPVKLLPPPKLSFTSWDAAPPKRSKSTSKSTIPPYIGLNTPTECVRIRTRPSIDGVFTSQLNLDDLLDAAISMLPQDAYALLLLVDHDLFEDDDDLFVCGRAYGGSRVAVISTARYHPILDRKHNVERQHAWPASHCESYMQGCCASAERSFPRPNKRTKTDADHPKSQAPTLLQLSTSPPEELTSAVQAALLAHASLPPLEPSPSLAALSGLWLSRVCRTAGHELGHCFGMDHCVYYACSMQGSSCLAEDARQPPYLCPVDLAKLLHATGTTAEKRYQALLSFCEEHRDTHLFAAFAAWIRTRLARDYPQVAA
ncbi:hypothetical protein FPV67DRAFT_749290 [Lyophyllum atratum]|nr:hypothetical protein FPV67DRAFT_749290 [Lyophyllum atratum]